MNFIVTGGCGFIGSHLVEALALLGQKVIVVDDLRNGNWMVKGDNNIHYITEDVCHFWPTGMKIDAIIHLANTPRIRYALKHPAEAISNNINPTIQVAEWARYLKCPLFFATSSSTIYSDEMANPYTFGKSVSEKVLTMYKELYKINYYLMYFYNVYGPREADYGQHSTVIRCFKNAVKKDEPLRVFGSGSKTRDFTYIDDVIDGIIKLLKVRNKPKHVHLGSGNPYSILDVAEAFNHPIVHEFDRPGEAQDTLCKTPFIKSNADVISYIKHWKQTFDEAKVYFKTKQQIEEIDNRHAESSS